jgi:hypothetical protein
LRLISKDAGPATIRGTRITLLTNDPELLQATTRQSNHGSSDGT